MLFKNFSFFFTPNSNYQSYANLYFRNFLPEIVFFILLLGMKVSYILFLLLFLLLRDAIKNQNNSCKNGAYLTAMVVNLKYLIGKKYAKKSFGKKFGLTLQVGEYNRDNND